MSHPSVVSSDGGAFHGTQHRIGACRRRANGRQILQQITLQFAWITVVDARPLGPPLQRAMRTDVGAGRSNDQASIWFFLCHGMLLSIQRQLLLAVATHFRLRPALQSLPPHRIPALGRESSPEQDNSLL